MVQKNLMMVAGFYVDQKPGRSVSKREPSETLKGLCRIIYSLSEYMIRRVRYAGARARASQGAPKIRLAALGVWKFRCAIAGAAEGGSAGAEKPRRNSTA